LIIQFGTYIGKDLEDIPSDYLKWIVKDVKTDDELVEEAEKELEFRDKWGTHFYRNK
jgi:uncharacterized protein (DUF3820 family)